MTCSHSFATAVSLQLFESTGAGLGAKFVRNRPTASVTIPVTLRVEDGVGRWSYAGVYCPRTRRDACGIVIETPGRWKALIYAARADLWPLTSVAARWLIEPPMQERVGLGLYDDPADVWYTRRAWTDCSNHDMRQRGRLLDLPTDSTPSTAELYEDRAFWCLIWAFRASPRCGTTAGALADFIEERGFGRLASLLRSDPAAARKRLPAKAACPASRKPVALSA